MKSLIDPRVSVQYISAWTETKPYSAIISTYQNSARICEVALQPFDVAEPLFWVDCADNVVADEFWYDTVLNVISPIENSPQPTIVGVQTI
jgi:hypothetical protein